MKLKDIDDYFKNNPDFYYTNKKDIIDDLKKIRTRLYRDTFRSLSRKNLKNQRYV